MINRSALVMHSDWSMYDLVNDVASYPQFMDGCVGAEIILASADEMVARLDLKKGGVSTSFTTRNQLTAPSQVEMQLEDGPFKRLLGLWSFKALTDSACKVSLELEFEFNSISMGVAASGMFTYMANNMVDAICRRAEQVYGKVQ